MKKLVWLAGTAAALGSGLISAQMPPPPPIPPGATVIMERPDGGERRELRRIVIRGEEGSRGIGMMGSMGSFLDTRAVESMIRGLELTPQQLGKATEYMATARPELRKLSQEMLTESRRLRELSPGDAKYAATSAQVAKRIGELSSSLIEQNAALRAKVWGLLTPEQRAKADARAKEMRERIRERMTKDRKLEFRRHGEGGEGPRGMLFELETELERDPV